MTILFDSAVAGETFACDRVSALEEIAQHIELYRRELHFKCAVGDAGEVIHGIVPFGF